MAWSRGAVRLAAVVAWLTAGAASAEVATDGTLGRKVTLGGRNVTVGAGLGQVRGKNLFHSFQRFDVPSKGSVTFTGPKGLDNVISRVTGGEASRIDGTLASKVPGADVYLVNPSGIVFGPGATLDVPGSFHASTADELRFRDGAKFSAKEPTGGTLSVAAPEAFGFLGGQPGRITVDRGALAVPDGKALSLVGGDVTVAGGGTDAVTNAPLISSLVAGTGQATIAAVGTGPTLVDAATGSVTGRKAGGTVRLTSGASVSANGDGGGTVRIS